MSSHPLTGVTEIAAAPAEYVHSVGDVFTVYGEPTQDSGNVSFGVRIGEERFFVKTAGDPEISTEITTQPERCELLRTAAALYESCPHPCLTTLRNVIASSAGPVLVYDWAEGELLGHDKTAPDSALARFRQLPIGRKCPVLDEIFDAHRSLAAAGWIAVDFYLGSILYDFAESQVRIMDLDLYRRGPFTNEMGRMFGSTSMMAPEEFELGADIDEATNIFTMGRLAFILLGDGTSERAAFSGDDALYEVATRACRHQRSQRYGSMAAFVDGWEEARLRNGACV